MFEKNRISVDDNVADEVVKLYRDPSNALGHRYSIWHSPRIRTNPYPWFTETFNRVAESIGELTIDEWWFNCGATGDEYRWHTHTPYKWAGVLYIQAPENSGGLEFRHSDNRYTHTPQAGEFLLFSGNLAHRILKNHSDDFRISVGFNFR
jgi:hypothetical protein